ncbi:MAG TPA: T9SS type A sorting domain-containing protein [Bacteroidales bacterium]|nr:T9SS type A sorting domain-containing protein [Bacteroidales bacterium]
MKLKLLIAFTLLASIVSAQNKLVSYEYWFNNDYANVQTVAISPTQTHVLNTNIDITALPNNVNLLNIRYKDENGKYSSTLSKLFVKLPDAEIVGINNLVSYEYWFNNDYTNVQTIAIFPTQTHVLNANFDITALPNNVNLLNIRYKDENGKYSSTLSKLFVKLPDAEIVGTNNLVSYEYWFNNDYTNVQTIAISPTQTHLLNTNIDITALPDNVNLLNIRYKDENGKYSCTLSKLFVKLSSATDIVDNKLTDYMYWFDNDFANATIVSLPQNVKAHNWVELLSLPSNMEGGNHDINIRFKDSLDMWSVPFSKTFFKEYEPRAEFNGMESEICFGTMLEITPNAVIDADSIYWNFGDGTEIEGKVATGAVQHFYASAGTYTITATMKHVASGVSNDTTFAITVHPSYGSFEIAENYISENFEATAIGSLPDGWVLQYNGTGNANQKVVDSPVKNGAKALQLEGATYWAAHLYNVPSEFPDKFVIESWMQTNSTAGGGTAGAGSLLISNINVGSWGTDVARIVFNGGNITYFNRQGSTYSNIFNLQTYQINEWYHIKMNVDLTTKTTTIFINNQQVSADDGTGNIISDFPIHSTVNPTEVSLIAGNDGTSKMFFDDVKMYASDTISNFLEVDLSVCESELPYAFGTQSLTTNGTFTETFQTIHGCDSTVTMNFSVLPVTYGTDVQTACESFTWIDGNTYTESNNIATYTLTNVAGCDSIVTLNLTINNVDVSVTQEGVNLFANATDAEYQWLDCNNNNAAIDGETNQSFTATQNGSYAVEVMQNNCIDTSVCYAITTVGILESTFSNNITIYPNPTDGMFKIDLGESLPEFTVSITDVSGKVLRKYAYKNVQILELNLDVQPGVYMLNISAGNKNATIKLIKK